VGTKGCSGNRVVLYCPGTLGYGLFIRPADPFFGLALLALLLHFKVHWPSRRGDISVGGLWEGSGSLFLPSFPYWRKSLLGLSHRGSLSFLGLVSLGCRGSFYSILIYHYLYHKDNVKIRKLEPINTMKGEPINN
jgi:hypothetical protein